jgi:hypothetical protein
MLAMLPQDTRNRKPSEQQVAMIAQKVMDAKHTKK